MRQIKLYYLTDIAFTYYILHIIRMRKAVNIMWRSYVNREQGSLKHFKFTSQYAIGIMQYKIY